MDEIFIERIVKRKVDIKVTCIENGVTQVRLVEKILL